MNASLARRYRQLRALLAEENATWPGQASECGRIARNLEAASDAGIEFVWEDDPLGYYGRDDDDRDAPCSACVAYVDAVTIDASARFDVDPVSLSALYGIDIDATSAPYTFYGLQTQADVALDALDSLAAGRIDVLRRALTVLSGVPVDAVMSAMEPDDVDYVVSLAAELRAA